MQSITPVEILTPSGRRIRAVQGAGGIYFMDGGRLRKLTTALARRRRWVLA